MQIEVEIDKDLHLPKYQHLQEGEYDLEILYGGRDSGKSREIAQLLIEKCLSSEYFRFILVRKTYESIKSSQYQLIKDIVEEWGLQDLFTFKESPMEIRCVNGNKFIARGCDKPDKLKSISNPSGAWYEEGNQLTEKDYTTVSTTLRTNKGGTLEILSFNPEYEGELKDNWIYKMFFNGKPDAKDFTSSVKIDDYTFKYRVTHSTYLDNPFATPQRIANYKRLASINRYYQDVWLDGRWGTVKASGAEFYSAFNRSVNVAPCPFIPGIAVHLTFDFNVLPYMTMLCAQILKEGNEMQIRFYREYCTRPPDNSAKAVCKYFIRDYDKHKPVVFYYGDFSGKNKIAGQGNKRNFDDIDSELLKYLHSGSDRVIPNANVFKRRDFINLLFAGHYSNIEVIIDPSCTELIKDLENVKTSIEGKHKEMYNDKEQGVKYQKYGHTSDAMDYLIISVLNEYYMANSGVK